MQAVVNAKWVLALFIQFSIRWKRKDWSNRDGEMKGVKKEAERADDTTNLPEWELQPWKPSKPSAITLLFGNPAEELLKVPQSHDYLSQVIDLEVGDFIIHRAFGTGKITRIFSTNKGFLLAAQFPGCGQKILDGRQVFLENATKSLADREAELKLLVKASELKKGFRKYQQSDPAETWASRWIVSLVAYLMDARQREEWLGDLLEVHREMILKGRPRWLINIIDVGQVGVHLFSLGLILAKDFLSPGSRKSE